MVLTITKQKKPPHRTETPNPKTGKAKRDGFHLDHRGPRHEEVAQEPTGMREEGRDPGEDARSNGEREAGPTPLWRTGRWSSQRQGCAAGPCPQPPSKFFSAEVLHALEPSL